MKAPDYFKSWSGTRAQVKLSYWIVLGLIIVILALVAHRNTGTVRVEMVPSPLMEPGWVDSSDASSSVKEAWGYAIAEALGNVTPRSAPFLADRIGKIAAPRAYKDLMTLIDGQTKVVQDQQVSIQFAPTAVFYVPSQSTVVVSGEYTLRGLRQGEQSSVRTYEIGIAVRDYRVTLNKLDVYDGPWQPSRQQNLQQQEAQQAKLDRQQGATTKEVQG